MPYAILASLPGKAEISPVSKIVQTPPNTNGHQAYRAEVTSPEDIWDDRVWVCSCAVVFRNTKANNSIRKKEAGISQADMRLADIPFFCKYFPAVETMRGILLIVKITGVIIPQNLSFVYCLSFSIKRLQIFTKSYRFALTFLSQTDMIIST